MVVNQHSPATEEFSALFDPIEGAEDIKAPDNAISMQGLSDHELVIAVPGVEPYSAMLIRDKYFVGIVKSWFDRLRVYKRS